MTRHLAAMLLLCGPLMTAGCMNSQPPTTLEGMRAMERQKLMLQCYSELDGERFLYGAHATITACSRWARQVVKVRYPQTPAAVNTYQ